MMACKKALDMEAEDLKSKLLEHHKVDYLGSGFFAG